MFALPLLLLYEGLAAALAGTPGADVRNAADVALKTPFMLFSGARGSIAFFATIIAVCVFLVARDLTRSRDRLRVRTFAWMLVESAVLALLLGVVVGTITRELLGVLALAGGQYARPVASALQRTAPQDAVAQLGAGTKLMLALGAGLYEELLFRVILVGGISSALAWIAGRRTWLTSGIAAVAGALIFSAFHYVGQYGDRLQLASFTYRAIAGLVFSGLFLVRGFGITAWTHALYDVYVMVP